jgi:hypothetical protein
MTTGVYIRVSSPKGQKTDSQRAELDAWLSRGTRRAANGGCARCCKLRASSSSAALAIVSTTYRCHRLCHLQMSLLRLARRIGAVNTWSGWGGGRARSPGVAQRPTDDRLNRARNHRDIGEQARRRDIGEQARRKVSFAVHAAQEN